MARKNKSQIVENEPVKEGQVSSNQREVKKFKPTEWARIKNLDPHLFLYWENQLVDEQEFENIKKKVM